MGKKRRGITRRQAIRRRRITKTVLFAIIVFIFYMIIFKTNLFKINKIEVSGNKKIEREEIIKKSTFKEGFKTFNFSKKAGIENIKKIPYIKDVELSRKLPNKIKIKVVERAPVAMASYMNKLMLIDNDGYVLETRNRGEKIDLVEISGLELNNVKEGEEIFQGKLSDEYIEFIEVAKNKNYLAKMKYINFSDMDNIVVELKTSEKIHFGNVNDLAYKLDFLEKILKDTKSKKVKIKRIELNKGENPVVVTHDNIVEEIEENKGDSEKEKQ